MAVNTYRLTPAAPTPSSRTPILSSYTCPRCRQINHRLACEHCGWTPDVIVGGTQRDEDLEDAIIAC